MTLTSKISSRSKVANAHKYQLHVFVFTIGVLLPHTRTQNRGQIMYQCTERVKNNFTPATCARDDMRQAAKTLPLAARRRRDRRTDARVSYLRYARRRYA